MVLKQLLYLLALARERHFSRAAMAANVSQPTLSAAIRGLETELGVPIVERGHHFNRLTPEGEVIVAHAKRIHAEIEAMHHALAELRQGLVGRLRLGVIPTALPAASVLASSFYQRYPQVTITLLSLSSDEIVDGIKNFEIDAGITYLDNEPLDGVASKPIYTEEYVLLTPSAGPFAERAAIRWAEAADTPLCLLTPDMQNRRIIDGVFRSIGREPQLAIETNSIFNLCWHAETGHWSSIVPKPLLRSLGARHGVISVALIDPEVRKSVGLVIAEREPTSPLIRALFAAAQPIVFGEDSATAAAMQRNPTS